MKPEERAVELLKDKHFTFTCAESCTGGMFSARMVSVSGVSAVYKQGFVTYANEAKHNLLGVDNEVLDTVGAVSEECARQMAEGAASVSNADVAISITGIAGPDGGTPDKPVGTVYIGCFAAGISVVEHHIFKGDRTEVREASVNAAIELMIKCMERT